MNNLPTAADIVTGLPLATDQQAQQEQQRFEGVSPATVPSRREELTSDLVEQQRHLRYFVAGMAGGAIILMYLLFFCTVIEIGKHLQEINQYILWFLSLIALPPTLLLVVLMKGVFAAKEDKEDGKQEAIPAPLIVKLIRKVTKTH